MNVDEKLHKNNNNDNNDQEINKENNSPINETKKENK